VKAYELYQDSSATVLQFYRATEKTEKYSFSVLNTTLRLSSREFFVIQKTSKNAGFLKKY